MVVRRAALALRTTAFHVFRRPGYVFVSDGGFLDRGCTWIDPGTVSFDGSYCFNHHCLPCGGGRGLTVGVWL
ncbi:hypothetical protein A2U01_0059513 [Trifolium medium]|uniref:Uncharacterized protein n=1 Tax=Trifolium medium TaxID=97028 RepID=A0A392RRR9_9FABA|nr:hypothetical protein [Trifolium medium]